MFLFTRPLYGLAAHPAKWPFPPASSILLQTRSRLHSHSRILYPMTSRSPKVFTCVFKAIGLTSVSFGAFALVPIAHCDAPPPYASRLTPQDAPQPNTPPPVSSVSFYQLTFGTVAGICAGIFIKKGAKAVAFLLGGIFVLLQYLGSASVVRVDWERMASKFENMYYTIDASGSKKPPTLSSIWTSLLNFLTADFQPRASFLAGLLLGLRVG